MAHSTNAALILALLLASPTLAQIDQPEPLLKGPSATKPKDADQSLVHQDFTGRLNRLEVRPEQAALDLLGLTEQQRAEADLVLQQRAERIDAFVRERLFELNSIGADLRSGDQARVRRALRMLARELGSPNELQHAVSTALPEPSRERYDALVSEYKSVLAKEVLAAEMPSTMPATPEPNRRQQMRAVILAELTLIGQEISASLSAQVDVPREEFEAIIAQLDLTPEQEQRVRNLTVEFAEKHGLNAAPADRAELTRAILAELTLPQQLHLLSIIREQG